MFDWSKPTVQMLGRWQPWHDGHTKLFESAIKDVGQVCIMVRDVGGQIGVDAGAGRTQRQDDNPFTYEDVVLNIEASLKDKGYFIDVDYIILKTPNIVDITYGRNVGYTLTERNLGDDVHSISATDIRAQMRKEGKLNV